MHYSEVTLSLQFLKESVTEHQSEHQYKDSCMSANSWTEIAEIIAME